MSDDEELSLPRAALNKIIKDELGSVQVSSEARELIANCCTEFVHLVASEANTICAKQERKTLAPDHMLEALQNLGFGDYVPQCREVMVGCKEEVAKRRKYSLKLEKLGIPEEELLKQQQELFAKAKEEIAQLEAKEWLQVQEAAQMAVAANNSQSKPTTEEDEYE